MSQNEVCSVVRYIQYWILRFWNHKHENMYEIIGVVSFYSFFIFLIISLHFRAEFVIWGCVQFC